MFLRIYLNLDQIEVALLLENKNTHSIPLSNRSSSSQDGGLSGNMNSQSTSTPGQICLSSLDNLKYETFNIIRGFLSQQN